MAGKSAGFAIGVGINDSASAGLDVINKRIAALTAPAERFNKSLAKFGDVTGINRAAEGMQTLGDRTLGAARAIERLAGPMAGIVGAGSLAGVAALSKQWATAGTTISKTAYLLNTPVDRLSALHGAAVLAHSSAGALDSSMAGLNKTLHAAFYNQDATAQMNLKALGIDWRDAQGNITKTEDALGKLADKVATYKDPEVQGHALDVVGVDRDLLPLLAKGQAGLDDFVKQARATGGVMSSEMAENAKEMDTAWGKLGLSIGGVTDRIVKDWSPAATHAMDTVSDWIGRHQALADSYTKIGIGIMALGLLKPAAWVMRLLGLGSLTSPPALVAGAVAGATYLGWKGAVQTGTLIAAAGRAGLTPDRMDEFNNPIGFRDGSGRYYSNDDAARIANSQSFAGEGDYPPPVPAPAGGGGGGLLGGGTAPNGVPRTGPLFGPQRLVGPRRLGSIPADVERQIRLQARLQGLDEEHMVRLARAEGGGYDRVSGAGAIGPMQLMSGTAAGLGVDPWDWRQNVEGGLRYYKQNLERFGGNYAAADAAYNAGPNRKSVMLFSQSGDASGLPSETQQYVANINGSVQVDVHLHGAPTGTVATATATGHASASPPRVEHSMPMVGHG